MFHSKTLSEALSVVVDRNLVDTLQRWNHFGNQHEEVTRI